MSFNACPSVQTSHYPMFYAPISMWGYAVNRLWSWDGVSEELNEGKLWAGIATPHRYPWFVDPQVFAWGSGFSAAPVVPYSPVYKPDWGVGANHGGGTTANASYADGHVASVPLSVIHKLDEAGAHRAWFVN